MNHLFLSTVFHSVVFMDTQIQCFFEGFFDNQLLFKIE